MATFPSVPVVRVKNRLGGPARQTYNTTATLLQNVLMSLHKFIANSLKNTVPCILEELCFENVHTI
jgi:hypothetical protein